MEALSTIGNTIQVPNNTSSAELTPSNVKPSADVSTDSDAVKVLLSQDSVAQEEELIKQNQDSETNKDIERLKESIPNFSVRFDINSRNDKSGAIHFRIVDKESGEVIREYPPEEFKSLVTKLESGQYAALSLIKKSA